MPARRLWSPEQPFLYDLEVSLVGAAGEAPLDTVTGYFGMRKIAVQRMAGRPRLLLNNKPLFQLGLLDQARRGPAGG